MINEQWIGKAEEEAFVDCINVRFPFWPGGTEKNHDKSQDIRCPGQHSNWATPEHKSETFLSKLAWSLRRGSCNRRADVTGPDYSLL
jgi:hypothetical protein